LKLIHSKSTLYIFEKQWSMWDNYLFQKSKKNICPVCQEQIFQVYTLTLRVHVSRSWSLGSLVKTQAKREKHDSLCLQILSTKSGKFSDFRQMRKSLPSHWVSTKLKLQGLQLTHDKEYRVDMIVIKESLKWT
jgi:hypothetical protein